MIPTIIVLIALGISAWYAYRNWSEIGPANRSDLKTKIRIYGIVIGTAVIGFVIATVQPFRLTIIKAGTVGVKFNKIGDDRGVSKYSFASGYAMYLSWFTDVQEFATSQQHVEYDTLTVITKGGFPASIKPTFNYNLIASMAGDMYVNLRMDLKQIEETWLKISVINAINDVSNSWAVDSIFNHRENFEKAIVMEAAKRCQKWFIVTQLRTNIIPPVSLQNSIIEKTKAIQSIQIENNLRMAAEATKFKKIALAQGDSADIVIRASAEAEAIKKITAQLNPSYNEYIRSQKWNGQNPNTVLSEKSGAIIQLPK